MQGVEDEKETVYCLTMILRFNHEWIPHLTFVTRFPRLTPRSSKMNDLRTTMTPKSSAASLSVFGSLQEATAKNSRIQLVPLEQTNEAHERHDSATLHDFSLFASWSFTSKFVPRWLRSFCFSRMREICTSLKALTSNIYQYWQYRHQRLSCISLLFRMRTLEACL